MLKWTMAVLAALIATASGSLAAEKLKVAVPQKGFWDSSWVEFGEVAGFFKAAGLEIEVFYTEGGAQTVATVVSGSVDIALSNGILGAIGTYVKGGDATPYRIISAEMTGACAALRAGSSCTPRCCRPCSTRARTAAACSPIPPVNTSVSSPPSTAASAPIAFFT